MQLCTKNLVKRYKIHAVVHYVSSGVLQGDIAMVCP